ncbi:hypothetical protein G1K46_12540 [Tenacibaculum finnmarkense]|uniref:hypothetical protein n=1 Tax=Tenacibaculum finnmarkense TaxID=2781243 RepID=UPI001EFB6033|nr:hypothetical protein [Tenacibaculum finnmarkense]MCG8763544.1 hypothetical protein [Tenacibaculum finnmarkense]MCG8788920.1 hypothetical protein [Tenacibaculum finnmarkense]
MTNYTNEFKKITEKGCYLGTGNPSSEILVIGKEVATDENSNDVIEKQNLFNHENNNLDWLNNIRINLQEEDIENWKLNDPKRLNNPLFAFKGAEIKGEGKTWRKYQKLHDKIFDLKPNNEIGKYGHNFQKNFFITEMSEIPSKRSKIAQSKYNFSEKLKERKENYLKSEFIQNFSVVILACSNYIKGSEIEDIFNVKFKEQKGLGKQLFWTHTNSKNTKLVIHTRQLSANVSNKLLEDIGNEIKIFMNR